MLSTLSLPRLLFHFVSEEVIAEMMVFGAGRSKMILSRSALWLALGV